MELSRRSVCNRWTDDEVEVLLCIYGEEEIQRELASMARNDVVYQKISARLKKMNINHTGFKVREKIKKLRQDYRNAKARIKERPHGAVMRSNKWYHRLDELFGDKSASSAPAAAGHPATPSVEDGIDEDTVPEIEVEIESQDEPAQPSSPSEASEDGSRRPGKRKRGREASFQNALRRLDDNNRTAMREASRQRERFMQLLVETQAQEAELRRQELEFQRADAAENLRLLRDFQDNFLTVFRQLADSLRRNTPADIPLD